LRFFLSSSGRHSKGAPIGRALGALLLGGAAFCARGELPAWMRDVVASSAIESALYRLMELPGLSVLYPRPPAEARGELSTLVAKTPADTELYALRARADEQSLDFTAAQSDWKLYVAHSQDTSIANLQLAGFYGRRLQTQDEIATLLLVASAPSPVAEKFTPVEHQRSWRAFERILKVADDQALPLEAKVSTYRAWIARYPAEPSVYAALVSLLIQRQRFDEASAEVAAYKRVFPRDDVFPLKAAALIEDRRGSPAQALALYDGSFQPLWPADLVQSYFSMLSVAHEQRRMLADARARLLANPDDLAAAARIFYYYQQQGRMDAARRAIDEYRFSKDARKAAWTAEELYTFAKLLDNANQDDEAARYYFALYSTPGSLPGGQSPRKLALAGIVRILLTAPDQGISLGSGNLAIYSDIAMVDPGPGYLNGILSLWLNSESPRQEFNEEEKRGLPYFHRAKAAELLAMLDKNFPSAAARPELHAELIRAYAGYGQDATVIQAGNDFLKEFPNVSQRVPVAMLVADAYARTGDTSAEFALYDRMLAELAAKSDGMPLTASAASVSVSGERAENVSDENADGAAGTPSGANSKPIVESALSLTVSKPVHIFTPDNLSYGELLDRYLGRLTTARKLPEALAVLRRELDRSPNDPLLYERLADFLQQNNFSAREEEVYRRAIDRFKSRDWYDKLARLFIRERREQDYATVTRQVVDIFHGTELEYYFQTVHGDWPQLSVQLNLYAHRRFPHDLTFTRNLLRAYRSQRTADEAAWQKLMREHWFEAEDLSNEFFDDLSSRGKLNDEIAALQKLVPQGAKPEQNSAAMRELAEAKLWQSHFEESAPLLGSLAKVYPADGEIGAQASSVYRSLAYFDASDTARAVAVEKNLLAYDPGDLARLARVGDILADNAADDARQLAAAAPYWRRMPSIHPGLADGYLQAATIFWDYFQFNDALAQIGAARKQFHDPALYGYETGAIYENESEVGKAIAEYVAAAIAGSVPAHDRLITLAARPASSQLVDAATVKAVADHPTLAAIGLRADILGKQQKSTEIAALIDNAVDRAISFDEAQQLAGFAQQHNQTASYRHTLRRQVALASDPVQKIEIQYALVQSLVAKGDVGAAQQIIDSVYRDHPRIVGVVRTTADFYWDHKQPQKAIVTLMQASHDAYPELARSYTLEAAGKSNESGDYAAARQLATPLLDADRYGPNSARCLAIIADSYARANDDAGLRDFYTAKLAALKAAQSSTTLSAAERRDQAALLRRGLILASTRLKDYAGAVDQQTALIGAFPEDAGVIQDAALYALRYGRQQQLLAFLNKAVTDSPRDSRFAIALGSVETVFEDYPAAIDAYGRAISIRKDRGEIYMARADLEERLQRFDDACADYEKLYFLSYKDQQWMVKTAEARARQGKNKEAVQALRTAWVEGLPAEARNYFRVADRLEKWNLLDDARAFAEQGVKLAGSDLLAAPANQDGAPIYVRILTRQRDAGEALKTLEEARRAADVSPSSPAVVVRQAEKQGLAAVSDEEWRRNLVKQRKQQAVAGFKNATRQMATAVAADFTPEDKLSFAKLLDGRASEATQDELASTWIPVAATAGLKDREAAWRKRVLLSAETFDQGNMNAFNLLEKQRMENADRGATLEKYASIRNRPQADLALALAEDAWRDEANHPRELAVLRKMDLQTEPQTELRERYFQLLLRSAPGQLVEQAAQGPSDYADAAANYVFANGPPPLAYAAIDARGKSLQPVWHDANTALAGLYFADQAPGIDAAFRSTLDDRNIGERVSTALDTTRHMAGGSWFYYGMRYGVYRTLAPVGDAEDYLASRLEGDSTSAASYVSLAEVYADAKDTASALREYGHALEVAPNTAAIHRDIALLLWSNGRKDEALDHWREALSILRQLVDTRVVPESFWSDFAAIAGDVYSRSLIGQMQSQMDAVLRAYIAKNGDYRSAELLRSAFVASTTPAQGVDWILSVVNAARDPEAVLQALDNERWLPKEQRGRVLRRELELVQSAPRQADDSSGYLSDRVQRMQLRLLQWLVDEKNDEEAQALYDSIPEKQRQNEQLQRLRIVLAAHRGQLSKLLAEFSSDPDIAPTPATLAGAANQLRNSGDLASNRLLLEYVFEFKSARHVLEETDFLTLAQARLDTEDVAAAVQLLRRMTLFVPDLYSGLDSAAGLLEKSGHFAEALPFLTTLATNTPWKPEYKLRLAQARVRAHQDLASANNDLTAIAASSASTYEVRAAAATELKGQGGAQDLHSVELTLLASDKPILPEQSDTPYFLAARLAAASAAPAAQRPGILRKAIAVAPSDSLRLRIFRAEFALNHDELALAAIQPLLESPGGYVQSNDGQVYPRNGPDSMAADEANEPTGDAANETASTPGESERDANDDSGVGYVPLPSLLTSAKEKVDFALAVSTLYRRAEKNAQALSYARFAAGLNRDAGRRAEIAAQIAALRSHLRIEQENNSRRPAIHESLDQAVVVRPRISAAREVQP
jgi:hypothetical protein